MTVKENLMNYTKEVLSEIAKAIKLKGYSKLKKAELAEMISEKLMTEECMSEILCGLDTDAMNIINRLADGEKQEVIFGVTLGLFSFVGYVHFLDDEYFSLCDGVKELVKLCDNKEVKQKQEQSDIVGIYCEAFTILYGVISLDKAFEVYDSQNGDITRKEFEKKVKALENSSFNWNFINNRIAASDLCDEDVMEEFLSLQGDKDFYIPDKEEIILYGKDEYCDNQKEYQDLRAYIMNTYGIVGDKLDGICGDVYFSCQSGATVEEALNMLYYHYSLQAQTKNELNNLQVLVRNLINNVRKRVNRGFTTQELYQKTNGRQRMFVPSAMHTKEKVGRNDPCPCGSGKKYKKCCGR